MTKTNYFCQLGQAVIQKELTTIQNLSHQLDSSFGEACQQLLNCQGRIIVLGIGKSGHIGKKISATLSSTGSPAFFIHPAEASHGDMGMITQEDVILAISYSGETAEILTLIPLITRLQVPLISITGNPSSTLAKHSVIHIKASAEEACPLGLAPTSSTTASLVIGDALAITLLQARGFTKQDFALRHPGGSLGRCLLQVKELMHIGNKIPKSFEDTTLDQVLIEMTEKSLGFTAIVDTQDRLKGIYTDGDLRRTLRKKLSLKTPVQRVMTPYASMQTIAPTALAAEALNRMETTKITQLVVTDETNHILGALHMHDLLRAKLA